MTPPTELYEAFELSIASELAFPALDARASNSRGNDSSALDSGASGSDASDSDARSAADLVVSQTTLPDGPDALPEDAVLVHSQPDEFELYRSSDGLHWFYDGVGRLRVSVGRRIDVDGSAATRQHLVLGAGVYSALVQRGRPVLHASAVAVDGVAVAFAGETGQGKSTAAAACYAAGHEILSDDVTAVEFEDSDGVHVVPAYPQLRVDPAVARRLDLSTDGPGATADERSVDVTDGFAEQPVPLDAIYLLESGDDPPRSEPVAPRRALFELLRSSYVLAAGDDSDALAAHQQACGDVARRVDVRRLVRPDSLAELGALVDVVEADVADRD